jgi:hypothetical protein
MTEDKEDGPLVNVKVSEEERMFNINSCAFKCTLCGEIYFKAATANNALVEKYSDKNHDGLHEMPCEKCVSRGEKDLIFNYLNERRKKLIKKLEILQFQFDTLTEIHYDIFKIIDKPIDDMVEASKDVNVSMEPDVGGQCESK